jgi:hypothetical protein
MDREVAISLLDAAISLNKGLGEMDSIVSRMTDLDTKKRYVNALGNIIGDIMSEIISPIVTEYPELNPYQK